MVDVGRKRVVPRAAVAEGTIRLAAETLEAIRRQLVAKGDVLTVAKIAAVLAAKKTPELIPLCHGILLDHVEARFELVDEGIRITASVSCRERTGAEMEALTAVSVAALTIYDMCKAVDHGMVITGVRLLEKTKGRS